MTALNKQALREAAQEEIMLRSVSDTSDAWQDEASPEAVLALLDELEVAQKLATQQGNIAVALLDEVTTLRRNANDNVPELRECLEAAEKHIAELEAREVTLPAEKFCPSEYAGSQYWEETEVWNKAISVCAAAIRAAGIGVKGE